MYGVLLFTAKLWYEKECQVSSISMNYESTSFNVNSEAVTSVQWLKNLLIFMSPESELCQC